uniref:U4/U6.U5 tri-snRNP-associated protein 1 n=1 Tax=Ciona intestinalis TaxID=7719 RepID=UPI000180C116|nr:U4/U6.U5 tri-snRNP-associated protein 1 [Ciona intestinalis]|eukprot:XP_002120093.1 U4/U6.U5 tri-snRNP-associated protein 1 [Ciona intestinalis]
MGSRKEHKHKKESRHKHKRKHRYSDSDEGSRSPSVKRKKHDREREHKSSRSRRERSRERGNSGERRSQETRTEVKIKTEIRTNEPIENAPPYPEEERTIVLKEEPEETEKKSESLSIEATNALRAKLGLKPLNVGGSGSGNGDNAGGEDEFVHAPAEHLGEKKKQEIMKEKILASKRKREIAKKMSKVRTLGEENEEESAANWVLKSRSTQQQREQEEKMMKLGEEFGVSDLIESELGSKKNVPAYTEKDLTGLSVEHSVESFREGKDAVLVIKDKDILASDDEDVLHSINIDDVEKSKKNLEVKRRGVGYKAYEEEEIDDMGFFKAKVVLGKYDEEIEGEKSSKFKIGRSGQVDTSWEQQKEQMKQEIRAKGESLTLPPLKIASEYLTEEEMKFKKRKRKVKKVRKRDVLKPEDILPLPGSSQSVNHGSRKTKEVDGKGGNDGRSSVNNNDDDDVIDDEEDAINDLQRALEKSRRAKQKKSNSVVDSGALRVAKHLETLGQVKLEKPDEQFTNTLFLNATDEFCRQLGAHMPVKQEIKQEEDDMDVDENPESEDESNTSKWSSVHPNNGHKIEHVVPTQEVEGEHAPIEAEPLAATGLMGALKLAERKGYLGEEKKKGNVVVTTNLNIQAKHYSIEDKNAVDYLDKYAHEKYSKERNTSRYDRGITTEFSEKKDYKPKVNIEYVDEKGRNLSAKEAFRKLSHRFHGKGSGKMKQEKRMKKMTEQETMLHMSSTDTPLNTVAMMKDKQRAESSPYIVLSGAGKTLMVGGGSSVKK